MPALDWGRVSGGLPGGTVQALFTELTDRVPAAMEQALALESTMKELAFRFLDAPIYQFIGSGPNLTTALLGAAKNQRDKPRAARKHVTWKSLRICTDCP